jgi:hypothetical protein
LVVFRIAVFALIAIGVAALWASSAAGGLGEPGGLSAWWGLLIVPYLLGWSVGIWGPDSPRWVLWLGIAVSLWYLALLALALRASDAGEIVAVTLGTLAAITIAGCAYRLKTLERVRAQVG